MSMKNSNNTRWDRTSDLPICSTALLCVSTTPNFVVALGAEVRIARTFPSNGRVESSNIRFTCEIKNATLNCNGM